MWWPVDLGTDEQYKALLEEMAPIAEQVAKKLNLQ